MISGEIEVNQFTLIRLISEAKFKNESLQSFVKGYYLPNVWVKVFRNTTNVVFEVCAK